MDQRPLLKERLAVLGPSAQPGRILVSYGPFEAKQSLPTKYLTLPLENVTESGHEQSYLMDITAHVVNSELRRESPVLRVLFHSGRHFHSAGAEEESDKSGGGAAVEEDEPNGRLMETCIALKVHNPNGGGPLTGTCAPQGLDGVCLASLTLPFDWWASSPISPTFPSLNTGVLGQPQPAATAKPSKAVRNVVELSYSVYETKAGQCDSTTTSRTGKTQQQQQQQATRALFPPPSAVLIQPSRPIGSLRLLPNVYAPRDLLVHEEAVSLSPTLRFIASAAPLYPHSYFYVTVLLDSTTAKDEPFSVIVRFVCGSISLYTILTIDGVVVVGGSSVSPLLSDSCLLLKRNDRCCCCWMVEEDEEEEKIGRKMASMRKNDLIHFVLASFALSFSSPSG